eukprot:6453552-Prymnesium_polylepis.1
MLLDAGMQFGMKVFLSQKHCQSMMDGIWRGGFAQGSLRLDKDFNFLATLVVRAATAPEPVSLRRRA